MQPNKINTTPTDDPQPHQLELARCGNGGPLGGFAHLAGRYTYRGMARDAQTRSFPSQRYIIASVMILFQQLFAVSYFLSVAYSDGNNFMSSPAAGEVIEAEESYLISWSNGTPSPVSIDLRFADTTAVLITSKNPLLLRLQ